MLAHMRFVLSLGLIALLSTSAAAAPWDIVPLSATQNQSSSLSSKGARAVQIQRGGTSGTLETIEGLDLALAARGLGQISAITLAEDGTLFTADTKSGRLWALTDRAQDGTIDLRRPLQFTFQNPTGLAVIGTTLYVADQRAIWSLETGQSPKEIASLARANSSGDPHILLTHPDGQSLILGLTTQAGTHRILKINTQSGQATLIGEGQAALLALAQREGSQIWTASETTLNSSKSAGLEFVAGQSITSLALPGQYEAPLNWPAKLQDHIIAAQTGPSAMRLVAIPTEFGKPNGNARVLVEGFLTRSGRNAWGEPGALIMDQRGLFFADKQNGRLWRLSATPPAEPKITIIDTASLPKTPSKAPSLNPKGALKIESSIKGTQIDASSTIVKPSSIDYGSKIIKDYDEKKAQEDAEKAATKPKKKRRLSTKRAQPKE